MSRRRGVMSESLKYELAKDLGFYDVVQREGWSGIRTKDAGNMVKRAIQIAQEHLVKQQGTTAPATTGYGASSTAYRPAQPMHGSQARQASPSYPQSGNYAQSGAYPQGGANGQMGGHGYSQQSPGTMGQSMYGSQQTGQGQRSTFS